MTDKITQLKRHELHKLDEAGFRFDEFTSMSELYSAGTYLRRYRSTLEWKIANVNEYLDNLLVKLEHGIQRVLRWQ